MLAPAPRLPRRRLLRGRTDGRGRRRRPSPAARPTSVQGLSSFHLSSQSEWPRTSEHTGRVRAAPVGRGQPGARWQTGNAACWSIGGTGRPFCRHDVHGGLASLRPPCTCMQLASRFYDRSWLVARRSSRGDLRSLRASSAVSRVSTGGPERRGDMDSALFRGLERQWSFARVQSELLGGGPE